MKLKKQLTLLRHQWSKSY